MSYPVAKIIENGQDADGTYYRRENGVEVCAFHFAGVPSGSTPVDRLEVEGYMGGIESGSVDFKGGAPRAFALSAITQEPIMMHLWPQGRSPGSHEYTGLIVAQRIRPALIDGGIGVTIAFTVSGATVSPV